MDFDAILKGYTDEQYSEALYQTLANYLYFKGLIDLEDFAKFQEENFPKLLEKIKDRDRAKAKETYEKYMKEKDNYKGE